LKSILYVLEEGGRDDRWPTEEVARLFKELPDFASEYIDLQRGKGFEGDPRESTRCDFHAHGRDEPCAGNINRKRKSQRGEKSDQNKRPRGVELDSMGFLQDFDFDSLFHP
jgi:hypothetical protein